MRRYFQRIEQRAEELGNFRRKPLRALEIHGRRLIDCLEASGRFDRVHLEQLATDFGSEMDAVLEAGRDEEEKLILLGTYFGLQFLLMNIRSIDLLRSSAAGAENPLAVYREFLRKAAEDFEELIRAYLERLLELFLAGGERPEFIVCAVGTRLHQDDVDMGIIDDGSPARTRLNRAIGRMAREMMRWTSLPDFYLSEHIGEQGFTVSIDEYRERLDRRILDFVSASEILSARPIVGSRRLFRRFQRLIHDRYFHARRKPRREHEGYLRGLLGEIESLLLWPRAPERISPKDDLLRLVGGVLWAYRTVERVREADAWQAFGRLARSPARRRNLFISLERSFTFVETFRHLYQQFAAQEETIDLTDPQQQESLERVANAMGYEAVGVVGAGQQLIVHYLEHVKEGRKAVRDLVPPISDHIRKITVFADWLGPIAPAGPIQGSQSLASEFQRRVLYFQGVKYWNDLLDALENREGGLLDAMLRELEAMDGAARDQTLLYFARWGYHTFYTMLRLLAIVREGARARGRPDLFASLDRAFLETIEGTPDEIRRFSTVFLYYPDLVYRYLSQVDDETLEYLRRRLGGQVWDIEVAANQKRLLSFCEILETSSRFFR
ncbi:MAG: hypothetical protein JXA90_06385, partial [Planctomycetes bacterium]|nr:hypothetical protein [Planctomycetota bacterium]